MSLLLRLKEDELLQILFWGVFNSVETEILFKRYHRISTSEDITGFSKLSTNFTLNLIIFDRNIPDGI